MTPGAPVPVFIEKGTKRVFAGAIEWPGWCRTARTEEQALHVLGAYAPRYEPVAARAGLALPDAAGFTVAERVTGTATTDFGAPDAALAGDTQPLRAAEVDRLVALIHAAWGTIDDVASRAPASLRKGPRGGGRDRDRMLEHVLSAEQAYARKIGVRLAQPGVADVASIRAFREAIVAFVRNTDVPDPNDDAKRWTIRYFTRRLTWHALDHAWEMDDRSLRD